MLLNKTVFFDTFTVSCAKALPEVYGSYFGEQGGKNSACGAAPRLICCSRPIHLIPEVRRPARFKADCGEDKFVDPFVSNFQSESFIRVLGSIVG